MAVSLMTVVCLSVLPVLCNGRNLSGQKNSGLITSSSSLSQKRNKSFTLLAFFVFDGGGEDFGCAVRHRRESTDKSLLKYMRKVSASDETEIPCAPPLFDKCHYQSAAAVYY